MRHRRLLLTTTAALLLLGSSCSTSGGDVAATTTTTTTAKADKTTTTEKTTTTIDRSDAADDIAGRLSGALLSSAEARCFAKAFVADASADGVDRAASGKGDPSDLSTKDQKAFVSAADGCVELSDLADTAAKSAVEGFGESIPLTGGEETCVSANLAKQYDSSGRFLLDVTGDDAKTEELVNQALGACIQPETLKAVITAEMAGKVPPAVADCVAQGFIDQTGGTAAAFEALRAAGSGGDTSALQAKVTAITQACVASTGAGG